jgi:hypothetical protein
VSQQDPDGVAISVKRTGCVRYFLAQLAGVEGAQGAMQIWEKSCTEKKAVCGTATDRLKLCIKAVVKAGLIAKLVS